MKTLIQEIKTSILVTLALGLLLCGLYPLLVFGISNVLFPTKSKGSLISHEDKVLGSELIGQSFISARYFHPRPSAAGKGYDATSSSGSNLGPTSQKFIETVRANILAYRALNGLGPDIKIPGDAVTASGSGLDPHISPRNAQLQTPRIARERNLPIESVNKLVRDNTEGPSLGFIGDPSVNVLKLNIALDKSSGH